MTVYVDNGRRPLGRMIMCHMLADSEAELHAMAAAIGMKRAWFQHDHYDLSQTRKADAIRRGAVEVTSREIVRVRRRFRLARARAGTFDTDPCAAEPRPWACAARNITERENSLGMNWRGFGRVWLNPPFDRRVVGEFIRRLAAHGHGTALVHVRTETEWFRPIWEHATGLLFLAGRYVFHNSDGTLCGIENPASKYYGKPANSGAPLVLAAFGRTDADVLAGCGIDGYFVALHPTPAQSLRACADPPPPGEGGSPQEARTAEGRTGKPR